jgi:ADP-dependent NAD(P)H-hydrate dehydratase
MSRAEHPADLPRLRPRAAASSKRDYGRVTVVGGAAGMAGAPALSAMAALRSGAGLVELLVPDVVLPIAAAFDPCVMTHGLAAEQGGFAAAAGEVIAPRAAEADAIAVGPGIGRTQPVQELVLGLWRNLSEPAVFDADALWALAQVPRERLRTHAGPRVITPHQGEMQRLLGRPGSADVARSDLERAAAELAADIHAVIVLKGPSTLSVGDGRSARNETGNPGMATAGTGDVLTGVVAALLAQGLSPFDAARLAAWVHGRAGDAAAQDLGQVSMTARDLLDRLHVGFRAVAANASPA